MHRLLFILLAAITAPVFANNIVIYNAPYGYAPSYWPQRVEAFDDSVFNLTPPPAKARSGRVYDYEPEPSTADRKAWIKKCAPMRDRSHRAFQDCYEAQKMSAAARAK